MDTTVPMAVSTGIHMIRTATADSIAATMTAIIIHGKGRDACHISNKYGAFALWCAIRQVDNEKNISFLVAQLLLGNFFYADSKY